MGRRVLSRHRLDGVDDIKAPRATNVELPLEHTLLEHRIKGLARLELDQEVNAVLIRRLPLVDRRPRIPLAIRQRCDRRRARSEDQSVRLVLELGIQNRLNRILHRRTIAGQEELGLHAQRLAVRLRREVLAQIRHELPSTPQARSQRIRNHVLVGREERKARRVLAAERVDVEDAEEIAVLDVLAIHHIANVQILHGCHTRPRDRAVRANHQYALVAHNRDETPLAVRLIGDRVSRQNVIGTISPNVATLHGDRVEELVSCRIELHAVALDVRGRQNEGRALEGDQEILDVDNQRLHDPLGIRLAIQNLYL